MIKIESRKSDDIKKLIKLKDVPDFNIVCARGEDENNPIYLLRLEAKKEDKIIACYALNNGLVGGIDSETEVWYPPHNTELVLEVTTDNYSKNLQ